MTVDPFFKFRSVEASSSGNHDDFGKLVRQGEGKTGPKEMIFRPAEVEKQEAMAAMP
jgi:hypothetical protein